MSKLLRPMINAPTSCSGSPATSKNRSQAVANHAKTCVTGHRPESPRLQSGMNGRQLGEQMVVVRDCGWLVGRAPTRVADRGIGGVRQGRDLRMLVDEYTLRLCVCVC